MISNVDGWSCCPGLALCDLGVNSCHYLNFLCPMFSFRDVCIALRQGSLDIVIQCDLAHAAVHLAPRDNAQPSMSGASFHGWTASSIMASDKWTHPRDLTVVELWCGVMSIVSAARAHGFEAEGYDINRIPGITDDETSEKSENIIGRTGFHNAVALVMRLRPQGLLWMAPVCSSWTFANSSNTGRKKSNIEGCLEYRAVKEGNAMATVASILMELAWLRGLAAVIENPSSSLIFKFSDVETCLKKFKAVVVNTPRCAFDDQPAGKRYYKLYKFAAVGPAGVPEPAAWIRSTVRSCTCPDREHISLMTRSATGAVSGKLSELKKSAAYPAALGVAVVDAWQGTASPSPRDADARILKKQSLQWLQPTDDAEAGDDEVGPAPAEDVCDVRKVCWLNPRSDDSDSDADTLVVGPARDRSRSPSARASWLSPSF